MIRNRRDLQAKFTQLRIRARALEKQRAQAAEAADTTTYFDLCVALKNVNAEIREVLQAL